MESYLPVRAILTQIDRRVTGNHLFTLVPAEPLTVQPGQFVELSLPGLGAFAVSSCAAADPEAVHLCIRRAGRVTSALYGLAPGAVLGLRGPFGNGFPLADFAGRDVLLLAGGLGMAPLMGLLETLLQQRLNYGEITVLNGARDPASILFRPELEAYAAQGLIRVAFSVDFAGDEVDATLLPGCRVGLVSGLLGSVPLRPAQTTAAVCGPPAMYSCVLAQLEELGLAADAIYATLERRMRCGVGHCCHCVTGGVFVCRSGPVFTLDELRRIDGAI